MNIIIRIRRWLTMSRRVAAFSLCRKKGFSDTDAMAYVNRLYPPSKEQLQYEEKRIQKMQ